MGLDLVSAHGGHLFISANNDRFYDRFAEGCIMLTLLDIIEKKDEVIRNIDLVYDRIESIPKDYRHECLLEILGSLHNLVTHSETCAEDAQDLVDAYSIPCGTGHEKKAVCDNRNRVLGREDKW